MFVPVTNIPTRHAHYLSRPYPYTIRENPNFLGRNRDSRHRFPLTKVSTMKIDPAALRRPAIRSEPSEPPALDTAANGPSVPANASARPTRPKPPPPKFNLRAKLVELCHLVTLPDEVCDESGLPRGFVQFLPIQEKFEEFIFQKYLQYNRKCSPDTIWKNIYFQLKELAEITRSIHPDYTKVMDAIYLDCFIHLMSPVAISSSGKNRRSKLRPKKKFCIGCHSLLPTTQFEVIRQNEDSFSRLCIRCKMTRDNKKQIEPPKQLKVFNELSPNDNSNKLDNPIHDPDLLDGDI